MAIDRKNAERWLAAALQLTGGHTPFPWQTRLLNAFLAGEQIKALDLPTGLGKTSTMAIWLVARACGAAVPRRLVYVVDRRAVVDQATRVAEGLRELVAKDAALGRALGLGANALSISTLRGQFVDNRLWMNAPELPAIIVGTVDMVGSRLLFEGYGTNRRIRPYQTGLMASDALVLLDEAHLAYPFLRLLQRIEMGDDLRATDESLRPVVPGFRYIALSATANTRSSGVFALDKDDRAHPVVKQRLKASKQLSAVIPSGEKLADVLAREAWALCDGGQQAARILVFSDKREVARAALEALRKLARKTDVRTELLVGERRVFERNGVAANLEQMGFIPVVAGTPAVPSFVFATSAGEVGVDLDADHLVCDLVEHERMVQRFGRVNRRGEKRSSIRVVVDPKAVDEIEEKRLSKGVLRKLLKAYLREGDRGQVSPDALAALQRAEELQPVLKAATTPEPLRPELSRALLDTWALTSLESNPGRPEVQPWLRGWEKDSEPPVTSLIFRAHLPIREGQAANRKDVEGYLEAAPPHESERLEAPAYRVLDWLEQRVAAVSRDAAEGGTGRLPPSTLALVLDDAGEFERGLLAADLKDKKDRVARALARRTLIVDAALGGLQDGLLNEDAASPPATADREEASFPVSFRVRLAGPGEEVAGESWRTVWSLVTRVTPDGEPAELLMVDARRIEGSSEEARSVSRAQLLEEHQAWAAGDAREIARALALPAEYEEMLVCAARLHDEGKRADRWQRAFRAKPDGVYAKTLGPIDQRRLDGYRHELGSLPRAADDAEVRRMPEELRDLTLHLIASHHGNARPTLSTQSFDDLPPSRARELQAEVALRFGRLQRKWGSWGLAWWESLLRAADVRASRRNEEAR